MKWILTTVLLASFGNAPAFANESTDNLINVFKNDFITFMTSDWNEYSVKEYFSKRKKNCNCSPPFALWGVQLHPDKAAHWGARSEP